MLVRVKRALRDYRINPYHAFVTDLYHVLFALGFIDAYLDIHVEKLRGVWRWKFWDTLARRRQLNEQLREGAARLKPSFCSSMTRKSHA